MFSVHPSQYRSNSKNPRSCTASGTCIYFGNDCTAFLYASKNNPSLLLKCWNTEPLAMPNCAAISSTRAALYPRSAKCRIATSTIRARFASERGRGFPSRLICVGFARLLVIPSMAQLPINLSDLRSTQDTALLNHFSMAFVRVFVNFLLPGFFFVLTVGHQVSYYCDALANAK